MLSSLDSGLLAVVKTLEQILTAGVAITAFALLLYALTFNLRDRVARSFALILGCVVLVFTADAIGSSVTVPGHAEFWLRFQWAGIIYLPPVYLHFSDALLAITGKPSRGKRRWAIRFTYLISTGFLALLVAGQLVGAFVSDASPAPRLLRTGLSDLFTLYYGGVMLLSVYNLVRAYRRTTTPTSRRRMIYLLAGATAPALGSYPYMLYASGLFADHPVLFWSLAALSALIIGGLVVIMAYAVAFFGVPWPDRVVRSRLFKWLMRGPVTASIVLGLVTIVRRAGAALGEPYTAAVPIVMVASILLIEYAITLFAPLWERGLFHGNDREELKMLESVSDRLLTRNDLRQFLEVVVAAVCDRLQARGGFIGALNDDGLTLVVTTGDDSQLMADGMSGNLIEIVSDNHSNGDLFRWGEYGLVALIDHQDEDEKLIGILGFVWKTDYELDEDQVHALMLLANRATVALRDRSIQQQVLRSLQALNPQVALIEKLRAASRYNKTEMLAGSEDLQAEDFTLWVKEALTHYWGGPKLTESPLMRLKIVRDGVQTHEGSDANALRAILKRAIEQVRPEGERRFTAEWILYNILELKFLEGRKVREVAQRLAMSEADLYRKQRVAIEAVAKAILEMENVARQDVLTENEIK